MRATCPAFLILFDLATVTIRDEAVQPNEAHSHATVAQSAVCSSPAVPTILPNIIVSSVLNQLYLLQHDRQGGKKRQER